MEIVQPKVFHLAYTDLDYVGSADFLEFHGVGDWKTDAPSAAEKLLELAGRRCYKSFVTEDMKAGDLNPNISRVREGNDTYIANILKVKHGSVIEHAYDTFAIENVTRVFTHEVVRHRLCNFSQESLRFVRPTSLDAYFPNVFYNLPSDLRSKVTKLFKKTFHDLEDVQKELIIILGMDDAVTLFADKKKLQSAMRRLMPIGLSTGIIVTTNHRNWRHLIEMRTSRHSEEEIRKVFELIAFDFKTRYPNLYQDMRYEYVDNIAEFTFDSGRV